MWYLVLTTVSILIPQQYPTKEACLNAGKEFYSRSPNPDAWYMCGMAPTIKINPKCEAVSSGIAICHD